MLNLYRRHQPPRDSANYATKNLERLRGFFRFCMHDDWIAKNPAKAVKAPR